MHRLPPCPLHHGLLHRRRTSCQHAEPPPPKWCSRQRRITEMWQVDFGSDPTTDARRFDYFRDQGPVWRSVWQVHGVLSDAVGDLHVGEGRVYDQDVQPTWLLGRLDRNYKDEYGYKHGRYLEFWQWWWVLNDYKLIIFKMNLNQNLVQTISLKEAAR